MTEYNPLHLIPPGGLLYFNYGLAFIFLAVAIVTKDMKGSRLRLAGPLKYLALFGFTHGTQEWFELFLLFQGPQLTQPQMLLVKTIGFSFGVASFFFLIQFGILLMHRTIEMRNHLWLHCLQLVIGLFWIVAISYQWFMEEHLTFDFIQRADIISRYSLALTGSLLTAIALNVYSRTVKKKSTSSAKNLFFASVAFLLYGIFAGLIPSKFIIPYIQTPIEFLRMSAAVFITLFIVKALNIFDQETRKIVAEQTQQLIQSEKLASLGQLAAGVAHEINNPLTNASLNLQMIKKVIERENMVDVSITKKLEAIGRNIERASTIAGELLQFSRNDTEMLSQIDINASIQSALDTLDYKLEKVTVNTHFDDIPKVTGNLGKLQQVLINILNNSHEAMKGSGTIDITTQGRDSTAIITVKDDGAGIPKEKLEKLFDPFFTTKEIGSGTGLGLFICYGILQQHNGTINIKSKMNHGTEVTIELPMHKETF